MTAVIYARYSSDNQREESIEGQIRECTAYAEKNGITVIKHYIDRAFSAKTDNRPEFQQMIKDSGKKLFDVVLVWKFDRFARNRFDSANYKMILKKNGVHLISVMEPIAEGSQGILVETLLEGMAEGMQQKDRAEGLAGRFGRPGNHEADSGRCGDRQDRSIDHGCLESGKHHDPAAGKATARGQQKAGQPDEGD